ncbi:NUDIX domain-containing protein [Streptomyces thermoviolaceus]|uniref:NUDIX domain-containing protein n=1 Tax=Streptomyces thermoviolaceus TaxID=1952 RepID=UPI00203A53D0|nr:NUDIX domain-containing protein [Streptomyces thermoviolaceus]MCM3264632.1 NUDIX domain-containing protein [Streptomyces thermoviolaceus]
MKRIIARLWRAIRGPVQWRILWLADSTFMVGVTGIVRDDQGRVLVLRHRMWPPGREWGLPTGFAKAGEDFGTTVVREVREETGLEVEPGRLVRLKSGYRLRVEVAYEAHLVGDATPRVDDFEVLEARWCPPDSLPAGMQEAHKQLIADTAPDDQVNGACSPAETVT